MKYLVNGIEVELDSRPEGIEAKLVDGLVYLRTGADASTGMAVRRGDTVWVSFQGRQFKVERALSRSAQRGAASTGEFKAPMPGQVVEVFVSLGESVQKGQKLLVIEAMKTQQPIIAPFDGTIKQLPVSRGEQLAEGGLLVVVEASEVA